MFIHSTIEFLWTRLCIYDNATKLRLFVHITGGAPARGVPRVLHGGRQVQHGGHQHRQHRLPRRCRGGCPLDELLLQYCCSTIVLLPPTTTSIVEPVMYYTDCIVL